MFEGSVSHLRLFLQIFAEKAFLCLTSQMRDKSDANGFLADTLVGDKTILGN